MSCIPHKCLSKFHNLKAAWQLKTFLTLNWTHHLRHSQNVLGDSLQSFTEESTHITHSVEDICRTRTESLALGDCNNMFVTQNIAKYFAATKPSRTMGQTVHVNKAGGHVVVYVRATCWVGPSKWPLLGHFRPSGQQPLNPDICVSDCLAGTSHSQVPHRALGL